MAFPLDLQQGRPFAQGGLRIVQRFADFVHQLQNGSFRRQQKLHSAAVQILRASGLLARPVCNQNRHPGCLSKGKRPAPMGVACMKSSCLGIFAAECVAIVVIFQKLCTFLLSSGFCCVCQSHVESDAMGIWCVQTGTMVSVPKQT